MRKSRITGRTRESSLESAFACALLAYGRDLPPAQREYRFDACIGRRHRFDFCWPDLCGGVAVELDGGYFAPGGGRHNSKGDREKMALAKRLGWHVLHFTAPELRDSETVVATVRAVIEGRRGKE